jgi:hypothetical protein
MDSNLSVKIAMTGMPAVLAQFQTLNNAVAKSHGTLSKLNTGMLQVATVLGSFSTFGISKEFEQMAVAALAATNAITALTNAALMSSKSLRGTLWGAAIVLATIAAMQAFDLWQERKKEAQAARELAEANDVLAEKLLKVVEARRAEGKINDEQRAALVAAVPNAFDRGLMDQKVLADQLGQVQREMKAAKLLDMTKEEFTLEKERLEILFEQQQLIAETLKNKIEGNKATSQDVQNYRAQLTVLDEILAKQEKHLDKARFAGIVSNQEGDKQFLPILKKTGDISSERQRVTDPTSLREQMTLTFEQLQRQFGTTAQIIARGFTQTIGSAVDGIANSITGLLMLTMSWGDALLNIGRSIVQGIIESFSRMVSEWIVSHLIMKAVLWGFHAFGRLLKTQETSQTIQAETAKTPILAVNAGLASTSSYGAAALIGLATVVALIAALAATSFATGGYTGDGGKYSPAGIVHRGEYVIEKEDVERIGVPGIESMIESGSRVPQGSQRQQPINVGIFDSRTRMKKWLRRREGRAEILDIVRRDRGEV